MAASAFGYQDWLTQPGATVTVTPSSEVATLPAANIADSQIMKRWRVLATSGNVIVDFGASRAIDALIAVQPWDAYDPARSLAMLASTDTVQHQLGTTSGGSDVYDSGVIACGIQPGYGLHAHFPPATKTARYWKFSFTATSYTQSFTDWGRLFACPLVRVSIAPALGLADELRDGSEVTVAPRSGVEFVDVLPKRRALTFAFDRLTTAEGQSTLKELVRVAGQSGQVFFCRDTASTYLNTEAMLARLERASPITWSASSPGYEFSQPYALRQSL